MYMRICNAESQKRTAQGSHYKEDDRDLPLYKLLLLGYSTQDKNTTEKDSDKSTLTKPYLS